MRILITGASGFLGRAIANELSAHNLIKLGRREGDITVDLSSDVVKLPKAEIVVHAAGKAHVVPSSTKESLDFYRVNVKGTKNLLSGLVNNLPQKFVFISSVAVYGKETGKHIIETDALEASDPYGKSKIEAEMLVREWCSDNNVVCTILRLPLLAGPNPPGNLGAMIKGIEKGYYVNIGGGKAKKSMVLAEDVAKVIIKASSIGGIYNLTDGYHPSFSEIAGVIAKQLGKQNPYNIPATVAFVLGKIGDVLGSRFPVNTMKINKIVSDLTFDDSAARKLLDWQPATVLSGFKINN